MNLKKLGISVLLIIFLLGSSSLARTASKLAPSARVHDKEWLEVNRWRCPFYNDGRFGIDVGTRRDVAGGSWPYPLTNHYIFGAGIWVGALKPRADEPGRLDTLVSFGYNPNSGASELVPSLTRYYEAGYGGAWDRVYKYPGSWDIDRSEFKERFVADSLDTVLGLVPTTFFSAGDMWMCFSDADPEWHLEPGKPLGVDIFLQVYAWNYPSNRDIFFLLYKVKNVSEDTLKDMVLGVVMDADIGLPTDDMVGLIKDKLFGSGADTFRVRGVGYNYDNDGRESGSDWESGTPGAIAYKFLESPRAGPGDTMRLGMTAFKMFTIEIDPVKDPDQYLTLAGYDYRTRIKTPYDSIDLEPKDKRFIQCSGTFVLPPDSVTNIIVAVIAAEYPGSGGTPPTVWDTLPLAKVAAEAQFIYDQGWLLPEPPPNPTVRLIPSDHKVTITWNNLSELVPDKFYPVAQTTDTASPSYNPNYKEYDFEGYKIYRSDDGGVNWLLLAQCDVVNGIQFEDSLTAESLRTIAKDTGLFYTYVDEKVANGFTYYYAVNAFDYNFLRYRDTANVAFYEPFTLESGLKYTGVVPRSEPINLAPPAQLEAKLVGDTSLKIGVKISAEIVEPSLITGKKYQIRFLDPNPEYITWLEAYLAYTNPNKYRDTVRTGVLPSYRYYVIRDPEGECDTVLENSGYIYNILSAKTRLNGAPVFDGLKLTHEIKMSKPARFIDSIKVLSGVYSESLLNAGTQLSPVPNWVFRGSDFRIVWKGRSPDSLTLEVTDISTNTVIPYCEYRWTLNVDDSVINIKRANGWNFGKSYSTLPSPILRTTDLYLYICGQPRYFKPSAPIGSALRDLIQPGDTWIAYGPKGYSRAPSGYWYELDTKDAELKFREDTTYKLNVIVTPNPYIVTNRWEQNRYERQIAFTRLPNECKIRIFTLAGDLIRVIEHKESSERRDEPTHPVTNDLGGTEVWNLLNRSEALVASGIYIFHVESKVGNQIGKFAVIH